MNQLLTDFLHYYKNLDGSIREKILSQMPVMNPEGRMLSEANCVFLAFQSDIRFTIVAGFRQWIKHGRCVMKGQHGHLIFIPAMNKSKNDDGSTSEEVEKFLVVKVFDITQTMEIDCKEQKHAEMASIVSDFNPAYCHDGEDFIRDKDENDVDFDWELWLLEAEADALGNGYSDADPGL